jgi:hypothetical protein
VRRLRVPDGDERADLGTFVGRAVRLDPAALVRLRAGPGGRVTAWVTTPFDVLATRSVSGSLDPDDLTAPATALLTALSVDRAATVDPGSGGPWQGLLPPDDGWATVDTVPAAELEGLTDRGLALAREHAGPLGPPASLLDQTVLTVRGDPGGPVALPRSPDAPTSPARRGPPEGPRPTTAPVKVPLRCLFALSGMGFIGASSDGGDETVRVSATATWLRLDARYGAVVRRRITALPLLT